MTPEIVAHEILQLIIRKRPCWKWKKQCIYSNGINKTVLKMTFFDENDAQIGSTCFQLETGLVELNALKDSYSPTTVIDFLLEILNKTNK